MGFNTYPNNPWPLPTDGVGSGGSSYVLPTASTDTLGGVKVGDNLTIADGVLSASAYTLPTASAETLGGVKVGSGLTINDGVLSVSGGSAAFYDGEVVPANFNLPANVTMQGLPFDKYGMNFETGAGDIWRVAVSKTAVDLTDINTIHVVGQWKTKDITGGFIHDIDMTDITGEKYISIGYFSTQQGNGIGIAFTDTAESTIADSVTIKSGTGSSDIALITKVSLL